MHDNIGKYTRITVEKMSLNNLRIDSFIHWYSALGLVLAGTRAQSGNQYGSGTLHSGQVFRGSLPLLSPNPRI
jgi:hypothetical protein